jgi:hypothetical protein
MWGSEGVRSNAMTNHIPLILLIQGGKIRKPGVCVFQFWRLRRITPHRLGFIEDNMTFEIKKPPVSQVLFIVEIRNGA